MVAEGGAPRCVVLQSCSSAVAQTLGRGAFAQGRRQNARCEARSGRPSSARTQDCCETVCDALDVLEVKTRTAAACGRVVPKKCVICVTAAVYGDSTGSSIGLA